MWIGTLGGLHRYDGISITSYLSSDDLKSVDGNRAGCLFEDSRRQLWIGTENGICRYDRESDSFIRFKTFRNNLDSITRSSNKISSIIEDDKGTLWIASEKEGLLYLDTLKQSFVPYFKHGGGHVLAGTHVVTLYFGDNFLWVGTADSGLFRLDTRTAEILQYKNDTLNENSLAGNYVEDLLIDRKGNLWIATHENGLDKLNLRNTPEKFIHYKHKLSDNHTLANNDVTTVYEDASGNVWVCNENGGLHLYNEQDDNFYWYGPDPSNPFSISNISVKVFYQDKQGRLWAGSNLEGIDVADKYLFRFNHYYQSDDFQSINNNIVRGFLEDEEGNLWIATDGGGLNYFDRKNNAFKFFTHNPHKPESLSSNAVLSLCRDKDGKMWMGTWRGGINIFDPRDLSFRKLAPENYALNKVFYLMKDSHDNMWATAQSGGISKYDWREKKFTTYRNDPHDPLSLGGDDVLVILEDSAGKIWIATEFNGLNLLEQDENGKTTFRRFTHVINDPTSLANDGLNHIFEDSKKNLWIATEGGLSRFIKKDTSFRNYTIKDGLESNHIKSIIEDDHGFLWLGTAKGISRFDPVNEIFRNYSYNDGLQRGEFARYSVYKTRKGELVFGGTNGFNIFHPDSIVDNPFSPSVYITGLKIFNIPVRIGQEGSPLSKHISETEELRLSYKQSVFSFDFVALNYTHPHMNQYAFKMEGFENDWNYVGNQRTATYTSLDPGEYTFHVKASNNDGLWNEDGTSIRIVITPPFWQTTWFKISLSVIFIGMIYLVVQYRVRHLNKVNFELEEKVNERTSQLKKLVNDLQQKQNEVETTNGELKKAHKQLETINDQLDRRVQERTTKLVKTNQQLDRFVYSASHDLSAPLKSILGLINILKLEKKDEGLIQHLKHMERSVQKLEVVIYHLTQFSRNMGGPVSSLTFPFKNVVEEVIEDLKYYSNVYRIDIIRNYCDSDILTSDFMRVKIVLTNLISNAIKYRDKNKPDNYIKISFRQTANASIIEVEDNGIGIEKEHQEKIFDMFFRATTNSEGSGLGLYIVKDVVEKLQGTINVDCQPGHKTLFTISLPLKQFAVQ
jgi:signal transduction histidine kinase/ligand-binding sensor domain-containing protein